jgi:hypothetical protein
VDYNLSGYADAGDHWIEIQNGGGSGGWFRGYSIRRDGWQTTYVIPDTYLAAGEMRVIYAEDWLARPSSPLAATFQLYAGLYPAQSVWPGAFGASQCVAYLQATDTWAGQACTIGREN